MDLFDWIPPGLILLGLGILVTVFVYTGRYCDSMPDQVSLANQAVDFGYAHWTQEGAHRRFAWNKQPVKPEAP